MTLSLLHLISLFVIYLPPLGDMEIGLNVNEHALFDLNIFYFIYMKRDWAEHRCYVKALSCALYEASIEKVANKQTANLVC